MDVGRDQDDGEKRRGDPAETPWPPPWRLPMSRFLVGHQTRLPEPECAEPWSLLPGMTGARMEPRSVVGLSGAFDPGGDGVGGVAGDRFSVPVVVGDHAAVGVAGGGGDVAFALAGIERQGDEGVAEA